MGNYDGYVCEQLPGLCLALTKIENHSQKFAFSFAYCLLRQITIAYYINSTHFFLFNPEEARHCELCESGAYLCQKQILA